MAHTRARRCAAFTLVVICLAIAPPAGAAAQSPKAFQARITPAESHGARTVEIVIEGFQYNGGQPVTIRAGDSVVWVNRDTMPHTATGARFDTGFLRPGERSEPITFIQESGDDGFEYACNVHEGMSGRLIVKGTAPVGHPTPSVHSMVVTGTSPAKLFLHHIALFNDPHHYYHVTLEAHLTDAAATTAYADFRAKSGSALSIIDPEMFVLTELANGARRQFKATFLEGMWSSVLPGLKDVMIDVDKVVQFRRYDLGQAYPDRLTYQLYGTGDDIFLANQVTGAPNFQHVVRLQPSPGVITPAVLARNPIVTITTARLAAARDRTLKTAVLANDTHLLLSPPPHTLNPRPPFDVDEELLVTIEGVAGVHRVKVAQHVYFDVRILNK